MDEYDINQKRSFTERTGIILLISGLCIIEIMRFFRFQGEYWFFVPFPYRMVLLGMILAGFFLLLIRPKLKRKRDSEKTSNLYLMTYGEKIIVPLDTCELVEINPEEHELVYKSDSNTKAETFRSRKLFYNRVELLSELQKKGTTCIYVNKADRTKFFFDLDFLVEYRNKTSV